MWATCETRCVIRSTAPVHSLYLNTIPFIGGGQQLNWISTSHMLGSFRSTNSTCSIVVLCKVNVSLCLYSHFNPYGRINSNWRLQSRQVIFKSIWLISCRSGQNWGKTMAEAICEFPDNFVGVTRMVLLIGSLNTLNQETLYHQISGSVITDEWPMRCKLSTVWI